MIYFHYHIRPKATNSLTQRCGQRLSVDHGYHDRETTHSLPFGKVVFKQNRNYRLRTQTRQPQRLWYLRNGRRDDACIKWLSRGTRTWSGRDMTQQSS